MNESEYDFAVHSVTINVTRLRFPREIFYVILWKIFSESEGHFFNFCGEHCSQTDRCFSILPRRSFLFPGGCSTACSDKDPGAVRDNSSSVTPRTNRFRLASSGYYNGWSTSIGALRAISTTVDLSLWSCAHWWPRLLPGSGANKNKFHFHALVLSGAL